MLVELGVVEQRYRAVLEVLEEGAPVIAVARRYGVARQTVHEWLRRYADEGLGGLADRSARPLSCPHQMAAVTEARIVTLRREHPGWGPSRIRWQLEREGVVPLPGRSAVYRALLRHGLVEGRKRRRRREDYRRWERSRAMQLWQVDVMGRVFLAGGCEVKVVTGIDDHSRFIVSAKLVARATARPVCQALTEALGRHGIPDQILTDIQRQGATRCPNLVPRTNMFAARGYLRRSNMRSLEGRLIGHRISLLDIVIYSMPVVIVSRQY